MAKATVKKSTPRSKATKAKTAAKKTAAKTKVASKGAAAKSKGTPVKVTLVVKPKVTTSPIRTVEASAATKNAQFTNSWILVLILVVGLIIGLAWMSEKNANNGYNSPAKSAEVIETNNFQPSVRIGN